MSELRNIHLVVASFDDEDVANEALKVLQQARKKEHLPIEGAAIVHRNEDEKLHLKEVGDTHSTKGASVGALIGGAVGALFGPLGIIGGGAVGAYYGAIVAATIDEGIPNEALREIGEALPVGGTALVALTTEAGAKLVEDKIASLGGRVMTDGGETAQVVIPDEVAQAVSQAEASDAGETDA